MSTYRCPVCGYRGLAEPARLAGGGASFDICPSCGFQFGYDDDDQGWTYESWRARWTANGMPWTSSGIRPSPPGWDPVAQLDALTSGDED